VFCFHNRLAAWSVLTFHLGLIRLLGKDAPHWYREARDLAEAGGAAAALVRFPHVESGEIAYSIGQLSRAPLTWFAR
jgi:hypothetical protein